LVEASRNEISCSLTTPGHARCAFPDACEAPSEQIGPRIPGNFYKTEQEDK
jgi:hypothetical protein